MFGTVKVRTVDEQRLQRRVFTCILYELRADEDHVLAILRFANPHGPDGVMRDTASALKRAGHFDLQTELRVAQIIGEKTPEWISEHSLRVGHKHTGRHANTRSFEEMAESMALPFVLKASFRFGRSHLLCEASMFTTGQLTATWVCGGCSYLFFHRSAIL